MMIARTVALVYFFTLCSTAASTTYPPVEVEMQLERVSEHVYYTRGKAGIATDNQGFISNAVAVITNEGVVVVDALGTPALAARFLELIEAVTDQPVVRVIVTHYHADHILGLQVFKDRGAEILAPSGYDEYLDSDYAQERLKERRVSLSPWVDHNTRLVAPDKVLDGEWTFELGGVGFTITPLGAAHSHGDLVVLVKSDRVLISGDIIFEGRVPFTGDADTGHWLKVLKQLAETDLAALIPGHGPAASDPNTAVRSTLRYLSYVRETMAAAVEEMIQFDEAYAEADWSEFSHLPAFEATHRRNAFGVYLSLEAAQFQ